MKSMTVLLGLRDRGEKVFGNMLDDMFQKFKNKQGLFKGERKTYKPIEGFADEPSKRSFVTVASTVNEQLQWMKEHSKDYFDIIFSIEATNAANIARADLVVDGQVFGNFSTLELLRLKTLLDGKLKSIISEMPVRREDTIWNLSQDPSYVGRDIYESSLDSGYAKTTIKESYILVDPHPDTKRAPIVGEKSTQVNIADYTSQSFSGEASIRERAEMTVRYEKLYQAVIAALAAANNVEQVESKLGTAVLDYIFK